MNWWTNLSISADPAGNAVAVARRQISAVFGAPIFSSASTKAADSALSFEKYWAKPPLFTSDSTFQIAAKTFCSKDCWAKSNLPILVISDSDSLMGISFLSSLKTKGIRG